MIRRFAGPDGKLIEMSKENLWIGTRGRAPSGILFEDWFYKDLVSDLDDELCGKIENKFGKIYSEVLTDNGLTGGDKGAAFIDWVASMLVRTHFIDALMEMLPDGIPDAAPLVLRDAQKLLDNIARVELFRMYRDLMTRVGWCWKKRQFPGPCLILADHPICMTSICQQGGQMVVVPLSADTVMFGGASAAVELMRDKHPMLINFFWR